MCPSEHNNIPNEPLGSIKVENLFYELSDFQLFKEIFVALSWLKRSSRYTILNV
jgi:hypothetical protein